MFTSAGDILGCIKDIWRTKFAMVESELNDSCTLAKRHGKSLLSDRGQTMGTSSSVNASNITSIYTPSSNVDSPTLDNIQPQARALPQREHTVTYFVQVICAFNVAPRT